MAKPKLAPAPALVPVPVPKEAGDASAPTGKKSRKLLFAIVGVILMAGGGGGAWYFLHGAAAPEAQHAAKEEKKAPPTFVTLEPFTVNLLEENGDHYLQVGIVYQVTDGKAVDAMKSYMPVLRNRILLTLSSRHPSDIASLEGKQKLVADLVAEARQSIPGTAPENGVDGAFLSSFVIQ
jgi:flagellar FliL protein